MENHGILQPGDNHYGEARYVVFRNRETGDMQLDRSISSIRLAQVKEMGVRLRKLDYVAAHENVSEEVARAAQERMQELNAGKGTFVLASDETPLDVFRYYMSLEKIIERV